MPDSSPLRLHTTEQGDASLPVVVILHGLFGSVTNWRGIARQLSESYRVLSLDLRNHGDSPWAEQMSYPLMAADVVATLADADIESPVLLGHSMGGKTAMAIRQLDLAPMAGLVVADIAPLPYDHDHGEFIESMEGVDLAAVSRRAEADRQLARSIPEPGIRQFLLQNLVRDGESFRWRINLAAIRSNLPDLLDWDIDHAVDERALFIAGADSSYVGPGGRDAINTQYPRATIETLAGAGHWLHAEQPAAFTALVMKYLASATANR